MKNVWTVIAFAVIAALVIWGAVWYGGRMNTAPASENPATNATSTAVAATTGGQDQNAATNSTQTQTMNGLEMKDTVVGTGAEAKNGDTVTVNYTGTLDNGTKFDSSFDHGQPFSFLLGAGQVIKGWDLGVLGMKVGGTRELVIPSDLGYGAQGAGGVIPPNATLHFTVELLSVNGQK